MQANVNGAQSATYNASVSERIAAEREWHDEHFAEDSAQSGHRWFGTWIREWFYSAETARIADHKLLDLVPDDLTGKAVLDYGCGLEKQIWQMLAERGADTYAYDISLSATRQVKQAAVDRGLTVEVFTAAAEALPLGENKFDLIIGESILHHVELTIALEQLRRSLTPEGRCLFREPLQGNPLLRFFRYLTPGDRTPTERPFTNEDMRLIRSIFDVKTEAYFFLTAPLSMFVAFLSPKLGTKLWKQLHKLDQWIIKTFPHLSDWCWQTVLELQKPVSPK